MGFPGSSAGKESVCYAGDPSSIPGSGSYPRKRIGYSLQYSWASLVAQIVKNLPIRWESWIQSLGWEDTLKKGKITYSSILAWGIPMDRGACGLQSMGSQRVGHDWATQPSTILFHVHYRIQFQEESNYFFESSGLRKGNVSKLYFLV